MKVLVVNCYKSQDSFAKFLKFLKTFLKHVTQPLLSDTLEYIILWKSELNDYLIDYDAMQDASYQVDVKKEAKLD